MYSMCYLVGCYSITLYNVPVHSPSELLGQHRIRVRAAMLDCREKKYFLHENKYPFPSGNSFHCPVIQHYCPHVIMPDLYSLSNGHRYIYVQDYKKSGTLPTCS
jgi:hypothetical protein